MCEINKRKSDWGRGRARKKPQTQTVVCTVSNGSKQDKVYNIKGTERFEIIHAKHRQTVVCPRTSCNVSVRWPH